MAMRIAANNLVLAGLILVLSGCERQNMPAVYDVQAAAGAAAEVRGAPAEKVLTLSPRELNAIFRNRMEGVSDVCAGRICEVTGEVRALRVIEKDPHDPNEPEDLQESVRLFLYVPEYAAASIECYFRKQDRGRLEQLVTGQVATVRGKLGDDKHLVRDNVIDLVGCMLVEK